MTEPKQPQVTHWKRLTNPNYIGAHDLQPGQEVKITFKSIVNEVVKGPDGKENTCVVAHLEGAKKPFILNKTNMKIIAKVLESPYIEEWVGKSVIIYIAKNIRAFDQVVDGLRVKNQKVA
jgi:hypothetical protein